MLIIISDLHLTDGTSGLTIQAEAFRIFRNHLRDLVYKACTRADGKYKPMEQIELVMLGDILDIIRSNKWNQAQVGEVGYVRPWHDPQSRDFINKVKEISQAILDYNAVGLGVLNGLSEVGISLPAAKNGQAATALDNLASPERVSVKVKIYYLVGNHDWFFHLRGPEYNQIRQTIIDKIGLAHPANQPFPHDPSELSALLGVYRAHKVFARHGDIYDPFNYEAEHGRNASSLGDAIVVELINRFPVVVQQELGHKLPEPFVSGLKELDNVRPSVLTPIWINSLLRQCYIDSALTKQVQAVWNGLADQFLNLDFVRQRDSYNPLDLVDKLQLVLRFSESLSFQELSKVVSWVTTNEIISAWTGQQISGSYAPYSVTEDAFKDHRTNYIVYGHTHHYEIVPLDVSRVRGRPFQQVYFNSGTWRQRHNLANTHPREEEFIGYYVMSYLIFFKDDERGGHGFEAWSGALSA